MLTKGFLKSVAILASGTAIAHVLNIVFIPILTRLYGPEAFGILGTFTSISNILIPLAALSYPLSLALPESDKDATELVKASIFTCLIVSLTYLFIIVIVTNNNLMNILDDVPLWVVYILSLVVVLHAFQQIGFQWLIRKKKYNKISKVLIIQSLLLNFSKLLVGVIYPSALSLIAITISGFLLQMLQYLYHASKNGLNFSKKNLCNLYSIKEQSRKYADFPCYRAPQILINSLSQGLPIILLSFYIGVAESGFFALSQSILGAPIALIGGAVSNVFYPKIANSINKNKHVYNDIIKFSLLLACLGFITYFMIIFFGKEVFSFVFGSEWIMAGSFGQCMAVYYIFSLAARPAIDTIPSMKMQRAFLILEVVFVIVKLLVLIFGLYFLKSAFLSVLFFSIANGVFYFSIIIAVLLKVKKYEINLHNETFTPLEKVKSL